MTQLAIETIEPWHGTATGYKNHDCRCFDCAEAERAYKAEHALRKAVPLCDCGRILPHKGRCGDPPVPRPIPFLF